MHVFEFGVEEKEKNEVTSLIFNTKTTTQFTIL